MSRPDIIIRNSKIIKLYLRGVSRKQIAFQLKWTHPITYENVRKIIYQVLERRKPNRERKICDRRKV